MAADVESNRLRRDSDEHEWRYAELEKWREMPISIKFARHLLSTTFRDFPRRSSRELIREVEVDYIIKLDVDVCQGSSERRILGLHFGVRL